jgi:hypothetical protein
MQADQLTFVLFGHTFNIMAVAVALLVLGILFLFWRIQSSDKLDFADMITKDGRAISLTKVLQLIGGLTATWIMIKLTLTGGLTETILGIYLAYVGGIEGYSKFVAAKYGYSEKSVKDTKARQIDHEADDPSLRPPKE